MKGKHDSSAQAPIRRIVILRPNHRLGNALLLTPLVHELGERYPDAEVEFVTTGPAAGAVFERFANVSKIHAFPARSFRNPAGVVAKLLTLKRRRYDLAIDPSVRSRAGRFLLGHVRARERIGYSWSVSGRDRMLTRAVDASHAPAHCAQSPLYLLRSALSPVAALPAQPQFANLPLTLRLSAAERRNGEQRLAGAVRSASGPVLGVFAHATGGKCFPVDWWHRILANVRERAPAIRTVEFMPADGRPRLGGDIPALHTPDLRLLASTLAATSMVAIADCGIMHLADAAGARVLGLFKTTDPLRYGPGGVTSEALFASNEKADMVAARICASL